MGKKKTDGAAPSASVTRDVKQPKYNYDGWHWIAQLESKFTTQKFELDSLSVVNGKGNCLLVRRI